jgi:hypothetical protein
MTPTTRSGKTISAATAATLNEARGHLANGDTVLRDAHEALIDPITWKRAQSAPGARTPRTTAEGAHTYLLAGVAVCAGCGRNLHGSTKGRGRGHDYHCVNLECTARASMMTDKLEDEAIRQLQAVMVERADAPAVGQVEIAAAQAEVDRLSTDLGFAMELTPRSATGLEMQQAKIAGIEDDLEDAERTLAGLADRAEGAAPSFAAYLAATDEERAARAGTGDDATIHEARTSLDEIRMALRQAVDAIIVRKGRLAPADRVLIVLKGEERALIAA